MILSSIEARCVTLPFRFSFGHKLASRAQSENLIVKVESDDGTVGFGESIPRSYVTGETINTAINDIISKYAPRLTNLDLDNLDYVLARLKEEFNYHNLSENSKGASWCALELAILDLACKISRQSLVHIFGAPKAQTIRYDGVVPFARGAKLATLLLFYRSYGFETIKVKVGGDLKEDLERLKTTRLVMGDKVTLRVDANCAWSVDEAITAITAFAPFNVVSIEQPLASNNFAGLCKLQASIEQEVVLDESLCTYAQGQQAIAKAACRGFNIRVSKNAGILASTRLAKLALDNGINVHMGAQVGESGILSAAGRILACTSGPFSNHEGSDNLFLLKQDLTKEDLTVAPGGWGKLDTITGPDKFGLGVTVLPDSLKALTTGQVVKKEFSPAANADRQNSMTGHADSLHIV